MHLGTIKFYLDNKGFGFITEDGTGNEIFFHSSGLIDKVRKGDEITYEIGEGNKGPTAINIKLRA